MSRRTQEGEGRFGSLLEALEEATRGLVEAVRRQDVPAAHRMALTRQEALDELVQALKASPAQARRAFLASARERLDGVRQAGDGALEALGRIAGSAREALKQLRRRSGAARCYEASASPEGLALNRSG